MLSKKEFFHNLILHMNISYELLGVFCGCGDPITSLCRHFDLTLLIIKVSSNHSNSTVLTILSTWVGQHRT